MKKDMREPSFSICKAIAIILVVMSHACVPGWTYKFIYQFHVPIFFICAGYFFNTQYINDERTFLAKRIKGLYIPFIKWSISFLILHNLFFTFGLLNEQYGNGSGGVLHPYSWHEFSQRLFNIIFNMSGYDEFIAGSFWFFRALLIASIIHFILFKLFKILRPIDTDKQTSLFILFFSFIATFWLVAGNIRIAGLAGGGYRELLGVLFICIGFLFRQYRSQLLLSWPLALCCFIISAIGATYCPSSMGHAASISQFLSLLLPAITGFIFVYFISVNLAKRNNIISKSLVYVGDRTIYIFAFHLLAFKLVSVIKVAYYGLAWGMVGGHTVVNTYTNDAFWILYTVTGVSLPLAVLAVYRHYAAKTDFSYPSIVRHLFKQIHKFIAVCGILIKKMIRLIWDIMQGISKGVKDIINASNPKDE